MAKLEISTKEHAAVRKYQKEMAAMGVSLTLKECYVRIGMEQEAKKIAALFPVINTLPKNKDKKESFGVL